MMSKRTIYTCVTPLPSNCSRDLAISFLHDHMGIIDLSPVVQHREKTRPPQKCTPEEFHAAWYAITDRMTYLPGIKGKLTYNVCFHDLADGIQTHVYAPAGLDIKDKWTIGGNEPGEPRKPVEMGLDAPAEGLYLREDVDFKSNFALAKYVKEKNMNGHKVMVARLIEKAKRVDSQQYNDRIRRANTINPQNPQNPQEYQNTQNPNPYGALQNPNQPYGQQHDYQNYSNQIQPDHQNPNDPQYMYRNEKSPAYQNFPRPGWAQQQPAAPAYTPNPQIVSEKSQALSPGMHPAHYPPGRSQSPQPGAMELPNGPQGQYYSNNQAPAGNQQTFYAELPTNEHMEPAELA